MATGSQSTNEAPGSGTVPDTAGSYPSVSVIVCTRNRGAQPASALRSILATDYPDFEVLFLDQSSNDDSYNALNPIMEANPRGRYLRLEAAGKAKALNRGLAESKGSLIALTDDDCEPEPGWLKALVRHIDAEPKSGAVFGAVIAADIDDSTGYIPVCLPEKTSSITRVAELLKMPGMTSYGIGACAMIRRNALESLGGWDTTLSPGGFFGSGDDHDISMRLLLSGHRLTFTPDSRVIHFGFRRWEDHGKDMLRWGGAFGAAFAKYLRCGTIYNGSLRMLWSYLFGAVKSLVRLKKPSGLAFIRAWAKGFFTGMRMPLDKPLRRFLPPAG